MTQVEERTTEAETGRKWVYQFTEGNAQMRELLGGKGAGVAEMTRAGMPVPPGFTITTEACNEYYRLGETFPPGCLIRWKPGIRSHRSKQPASVSATAQTRYWCRFGRAPSSPCRA